MLTQPSMTAYGDTRPQWVNVISVFIKCLSSNLFTIVSVYTVKIPKRLNTSVKHIGVFRAFVACLTSEYQLNTSLILLLHSKHNLNTYFNVCYNTMPILNTMQLRIKQAYVEGTFRPIQGLYHSYLGQHSPKRKVIIATTLVVSLLVTRLSSRRQLETFDCHNDELFEHDISSLF